MGHWSASGTGSLMGMAFRFGFGATCGGIAAAGIIATASHLMKLVF